MKGERVASSRVSTSKQLPVVVSLPHLENSLLLSGRHMPANAIWQWSYVRGHIGNLPVPSLSRRLFVVLRIRVLRIHKYHALYRIPPSTLAHTTYPSSPLSSACVIRLCIASSLQFQNIPVGFCRLNDVSNGNKCSIKEALKQVLNL